MRFCDRTILMKQTKLKIQSMNVMMTSIETVAILPLKGFFIAFWSTMKRQIIIHAVNYDYISYFVYIIELKGELGSNNFHFYRHMF